MTEQQQSWLQSWDPRQIAERSDDPDLLRLIQVAEMYDDPDDPAALLVAQIQESMRQYAVSAGLCADCLAKFPDPLNPPPAR